MKPRVEINEAGDAVPIGEQSASQRTMDTESIAFKAGRDAKRNGVPLRKSALKSLHPESKQYDDFIEGYYAQGHGK